MWYKLRKASDGVGVASLSHTCMSTVPTRLTSGPSAKAEHRLVIRSLSCGEKTRLCAKLSRA